MHLRRSLDTLAVSTVTAAAWIVAVSAAREAAETLGIATLLTG